MYICMYIHIYIYILPVANLSLDMARVRECVRCQDQGRVGNASVKRI